MHATQRVISASIPSNLIDCENCASGGAGERAICAEPTGILPAQSNSAVTDFKGLARTPEEVRDPLCFTFGEPQLHTLYRAHFNFRHSFAALHDSNEIQPTSIERVRALND